MICRSCCDQDCLACGSVNCCCGHDGSPVRPLTGEERHAYMLGEHTDIIRAREAT